MSEENSFSLEEYSLSCDSIFSLDEYSPEFSTHASEVEISPDRSFSVEEYTSTPIKTTEYTSTPIIDSLDQATTSTKETIGSASPMHFKRVNRQIRRARYDFVTSDRQISLDMEKPCCARGCMTMIGKKKLKDLRHYYFSLNGDEQDTYLSSHMQMVKDTSSSLSISFEYYNFLREQCCRSAFKIVFCVSNLRLQRVQQRVLHGDLVICSDNLPSMKGCKGRHAVGWMKHYFQLHCEVMPTTGRLHLSDNFTRKEIFEVYRNDMEKTHDKSVRYSQFSRLWNTEFNNVIIPRQVRMGVCSICANLKSMAKGAKTEVEKERFKLLLQEHRDGQALERKKAMHHREKSLKNPERFMCLMIDGMDQKKTCLPHFPRLPKDISDECLVQMHLVGCLAYNRTVKPHVFITYPNVHNDPNLTVTVIQRVLGSWDGPLPPVLYVQLDNTARENKNSTVFGYLSMLVDQGVFTKIKVNFLLVGHTHDHIDQMFSTFSRQLSRYNAFTLPHLVTIICEAYTPRPTVVHLTQIYDFKRYISHDPKSQDKVLAQLNNISFNHVFLLKKMDQMALHSYMQSNILLHHNGSQMKVAISCFMFLVVQSMGQSKCHMNVKSNYIVRL